MSPKVKMVPGMLPNSSAVALSRSEWQEATSPAPTSVTVAVCANTATAVSPAATNASSTTKAAGASVKVVPLTPTAFL